MNSTNYYPKFQEIFLDVDKSFFNLEEQELMKSEEVKSISQILPRWFEIIKKGFENDRKEAYRTLKHIFKTLNVYFSLMNDQFKSNVHKNNLKQIKFKLEMIHDYNPNIFPLILLFHDIGRPFNRTWHTLRSSEIIQRYSLFKKFNLSDLEKKFILTVIEQHLLLGTIFTGESSYLGSISLWNSLNQFSEAISDEILELLFACLNAFTVIDIWGYDYSIIYDHYFKYYSQISKKLKNIFKISWKKSKDNQSEFLEKELSRMDFQNLKWRIACSLRIFQFVNTKEYLTKNFFYSKIEESLEKLDLNWEEFERKLGKNHPKIQFKYALPLMMILTSDRFKRKPIKNYSEVKSNIITFWIKCCEKSDNFIYKNNTVESPLFYYVFDLPRTWFLEEKYIKIVRSADFFDKIIENKFIFKNDIYGYLLNISL